MSTLDELRRKYANAKLHVPEESPEPEELDRSVNKGFAMPDVGAAMKREAKKRKKRKMPEEWKGAKASPSGWKGRTLFVRDGAEIILQFGKYSGSAIGRMANDRDGRSYLTWILGQEFPEDLKNECRKALGLHVA